MTWAENHMALFSLLRSISSSLHLVWASLWSLVAIHYGRAAFTDWRIQGGRWTSIFSDFIAPFSWAFRSFFCRIGLLTGDHCPIDDIVPIRYEPGLILRFSILLGSVGPIVFGVLYLVPMGNELQTQHLLANIIVVTVSIFSAGGHLFLAYRHRASAWRTVVIISSAVILLGPFVSHWLFNGAF